jgi:Domain of unknown function (DUF4136)
MTRSAFILTGALLGVANLAVAAGQQPKYGVTVAVANVAALEKAKTYSWTPSQPSPIKAIDAQIVAAVDRELSALGFTKAPSGKSDVLATYASVSRTDVDLKSKADKQGARREFPVGTLVVDLRDPATRKALFRVRIDKPLDAEPEKLEGAINAAVTAMFEQYPTRTGTKR